MNKVQKLILFINNSATLIAYAIFHAESDQHIF